MALRKRSRKSKPRRSLFRRAVRFLRLAVLGLSRSLEGLGWEVVSNPPRLGVVRRLACLAKARLGFG